MHLPRTRRSMSLMAKPPTPRKRTLLAGILCALLGVLVLAIFLAGGEREPRRSAEHGPRPPTAGPGEPREAERLEVLVLGPEGTPLPGLRIKAARRNATSSASDAGWEVGAGQGLPRSRCDVVLRGAAIRRKRVGEAIIDLHPQAGDVWAEATSDTLGVALVPRVSALEAGGTYHQFLATDQAHWYGEELVAVGELSGRSRVVVHCLPAGLLRVSMTGLEEDPEGGNRIVPLLWESAVDDGTWRWEMRPGETTEFLVPIGTAGSVAIASTEFLPTHAIPPLEIHEGHVDLAIAVERAPAVAVVDRSTGLPVAAFRVIALDTATGLPAAWLSGMHETRDGMIRIASPDLTGEQLRGMALSLLILAEGYLPESFPFRFAQEERARRIELTPGAGRIVEGLIRSGTLDVGGLIVEAYEFRLLPRGLVGPLVRLDPAECLVSSVAAPDGVFRLANLPSVDLLLVIRRGRHLKHLRLPATDTRVTVELDVCAQVSGRAIYSDGAPAGRVSICLEGPAIPSMTQTTDAEGGFLFPLVPFGEYEIGVASADEPVRLPVRDGAPLEVQVTVKRRVRQPIAVTFEGESRAALLVRIGAGTPVPCDVPGTVTLNGGERDVLIYEVRDGWSGRRVITTAEFEARRLLVRVGGSRELHLAFSEEGGGPVQVLPLSCEIRRGDGSSGRTDLSVGAANRVVLSVPRDSVEVECEFRLGPGGGDATARVRFAREVIELGECACVLPRALPTLRARRPGGRNALVRLLTEANEPMAPGAIVHAEWHWPGRGFLVLADLGGTTVRGAMTQIPIPDEGRLRISGFFRESLLRSRALVGELEADLGGSKASPLLLDLVLRPQ